MEDEDDLSNDKTSKRLNRSMDRGKRQSSDRKTDFASPVQRELENKRLQNPRGHQVPLGERLLPSASGMSQKFKFLGARPKTISFQHREPSEEWRTGNWRTPHTDPFRRPDRTSVNNQRGGHIGDRKRNGPMGFRRLRELNENDIDERALSLELISSKSGFSELLNQDTIPSDWMKLLLSIIAKACKSTCGEFVMQLLNIIAKSKFLEHHVTAGFLLTLPHTDRKSQMDSVTSVDHIIALLGEISTKLPTFVNQCEVVTVILATLPDKLTTLHSATVDMLKTNIFSISDRITEIRAKKVKNENVRTRKPTKREDLDIELENIPPPNHYTDLSICPTDEDIHMKGKAYVRANRGTGKFDDIEQYLDIQFRLLREDYVRPLREGIKEYLQNVSAGKPKARLADTRMYSDVQIVCPKCTQNGIVYRIQFDTRPFKHIRWTASKRLIYGSLVCLSHDNFDTLLFAVVAQRETTDLQQGFVDIRFTEYFDPGGEEMKQVYVMLETTAYFEAYRHVLEGLQELTDEVPFQRYIVSCETEVRPPQYLLTQSPPQYNLSCCLSGDANSTETRSAESVSILTTSRWPTNALCFNDSQIQAFKTAMTKEFVIIQGPPGTGKTYVGLKIVNTLLENGVAWGADSPLLVVCYTNHALDQFLEGMLDFGVEKLIRVGGRSKNERLQKYTLQCKKSEARMRKDTKKPIVEGHRDCLDEMKYIESNMLSDATKLEVSAERLLNEKALQSCMTEKQFECFNVAKNVVSSRHQQFCSMAVWLNLGPETYGKSGEGFGESDLFSLSPIHIVVLAYKLKMEGENDRVIRRFEQMAEQLEHALANDSGNFGPRWEMYRTWTQRFHELQIKELHDIQNILKSTRDTTETRGLRERVQVIQKTLRELNIGILRTSCTSTVLTLEERIPLLGELLDEYSIARWLGYTEVIQALLNLQGPGEEEAYEQEDFIDVEEEAISMTNHRLLDEDDEALSRFGGRTGHQAAQKMAVKELAISIDVTNRRPIQKGEWQTVRPSKQKLKQKVKQILCTKEKMNGAEANPIENIWGINVKDRYRLYRYWVDVYRNRMLDQIKGSVEEFEMVANRLKAVRDDEDFEILKTAKVIGMTTTGAARLRSLLQRVKPKIIVVEEAAEVLESHIISSLNSNCEHLILIGDHKQLRPSPAVYDLAKRYKLDISLFERMVNNSVRCHTLQLQHRMRPEIAQILSFIYPELENHPSVEGFEHVKGVSSDIFFLDHDRPESVIDDTKSRSNQHEAMFAAALCRYLLLQGYEPSQITVLTTYAGQVFELKQNMPKDIFHGVKVTAVDNYQGEENDIIILSLVRSNAVGSIGFLSVDNRVCVALSRAKMGLFVIGNLQLLADESPLWLNIVLLLQNKGYFGQELELYCQNHPTTEKIKVRAGKDFEGAPEGGCLRRCETRLDCGHKCEKYCHAVDAEHNLYECQKDCVNECKDGHRCIKPCYMPCGNCEVLVTKVVPQCNHEQKMPCTQNPLTFGCQIACPEFLSCGHPCAMKCSEEHTRKCQVPVTRLLPCNHPVTTACCQSPNKTMCPKKCTETLDCGHLCRGSCGDCHQGRFHIACKHKCGRTLVCGHECRQPCMKACPPCTHICNNKCTHSKCEKTCGEKCASCSEPCDWKCKHLKCTKLCGEICNREPCDHICKKRLPCNHRCIGLCGEPCPKLCKVCDKEKVCEIFFGNEDQRDARFVMLEDCGHVFEAKGLDQWMSVENSDNEIIQMKRCPKCRVAVRTSLRYGNHIKKTLHDIEKVKLKIRGDTNTILRETYRLKQKLSQGGLDFCVKDKIRSRLDTDLSQHQLHLIDNQVTLLVSTKALTDDIRREEKQLRDNDVLDIIQSIKVVTDLVMNLREFVSDQELKQFNFEILRISFLFKLLLFEKKLQSMENSKARNLFVELEAALQELKGIQAFTELKETSLRCLVERLEAVASLGISDREKKMIVRALDLQQGHWFKCPNGHIYAIGDCGGATVESKCPDCKAGIGGTNHKLRTDNQLAPEMDGASHAAWSDQANMENYRFEDYL